MNDAPAAATRPEASREDAAGLALTWACALGGLVLLAVLISVPMAPREQAIFAVLTAISALAVSRFGGRMATMLLIALSVAVSLRYLAWRMTDSLPFQNLPSALLGLGLLAAELYAAVVLVMFYAQAAWPRGRSVRSLPADPATWPSVDVFITTYDEPIELVRTTVLAALALDWPADRLRVTLLDDGRRDSLRRFAALAGCVYLARPDNRHAKAGNLNNGLAQTRGEYIAVFDCDHVPTRAFLQLTLGWLVAEPRLAVVQTPQHFYAPDVFQRNLAAGRRTPGENMLFHGLLQDGRDAWNAALFSGTGAVLRRAALADIGGFATETVTEDAHTMLKLHRHSWGSAFVRLPLSAGLVPEDLAQHVAQRRRWARGMLQILRLDNPLFGPGLTLAQRLGYLQASGHFLFALPRLVFLTAPLAYLLLGQTVIAASPLAVAAYGLPHLFHALLTSARLHRHWRHAFWSEIYETVLALALLRVTFGTLLRPRRGLFNVTPKGGLRPEGGFSVRATWPNLVLAGLLLAGLARAVIGALSSPPPLDMQALAMNALWAALSLLVVLAALAVGRETRQTQRPSIAAALPVRVHLPDGTVLSTTTRTLSGEGGELEAMALTPGTDVRVELILTAESVTVPSHVLRADADGVHLQWEPHTLEQEAALVRAVFGRADAWGDWAVGPPDWPLRSLWHVLASVGGIFRASSLKKGAAAALAVTLLAVPAWADSTRSPARGTTVRPIPQEVAPLSNLPGALPAQPVPPPPPAPAPVPAQAPAATADTAPRPGVRQVVLNLRQLGAAGPLVLNGTRESQAVTFGVRADEVVTAATLTLSGAMSPALLPEYSNIAITLNDQYVGTVPASRDQPAFSLDVPVSPVFFQDLNHLTFRFSGRYTSDCNDPLSGLLHATVYDSSTLALTLERLPPQRDLSHLPAPFFDLHDRQRLNLPVVLPASPGNEALRAAGIVAGWFGTQASPGANFPPLAALPTEGNAVVIAIGAGAESVPGLPPLTGPTLAVLANPTDPLSSLLVVAGRNDAEAVVAATALAVGSRTLNGATAEVTAPPVAPRSAYDAPAWISTVRAVKLGELVDAAVLQSDGFTGLIRVPFQTAPDFYPGRGVPFPLDLRYRAPPAPVVDLATSRLDVGINGIYLDTFPLARSPAQTGSVGRMLADLFGSGSDFDAGPLAVRTSIPLFTLSGANELQFYFDARPLHRSECAAIPADLRMSIDPDSSVDLSRGIRFAELPNLAFFVNSGFPFTRMADLSETAIILPERPSGAEIGALLDTMGRLGAATGLAGVRVAVARPEGAAALSGRDLLVIGTLKTLPELGSLLRGSSVGVDAKPEGAKLILALPGPLASVRRLFGDRTGADRERAQAILSTGLAGDAAALVGGESPFASGRSVVALLGGSADGLTAARDTLRDPDQAPLVAGDLALLTGGRITSYRIGATYTVGSLPFWLWPGWVLRDQPLGLAALTALACVLLGLALFWTLRRRARRHEVHPAGEAD